MRFAKYNGIGNDFVMFGDPDNRMVVTPELVRRLCDRRFGVGGDGVIRVGPGNDGAELFMDYYNSDGSVGEMCGNGIRCVAVFSRSEGLTTSTEIPIGTRAGLKVVEVLPDGRVRVDMGGPEFRPSEIPVLSSDDDALRLSLHVVAEDAGESAGALTIQAACLSMGNPHAVLFVDDPASAPVTTLGPMIEHHKVFPNRANVEFVRVESEDRIRMRVWERGVGETLACGTGACAAAVASRILQGADAHVEVHLPGGLLDVEWDGSVEDPASVYMTGEAVQNFDGDIDLKEYS
ncbi:MAG: diaminopimelate epimerase [Actinobacteria bacterium]|nr:diaminopimelate epimerase [Actinomycetota bacterium]